MTVRQSRSYILFKCMLRARRGKFRFICGTIILERGKVERFPKQESELRHVSEKPVPINVGVAHADGPVIHGSGVERILVRVRLVCRIDASELCAARFAVERAEVPRAIVDQRVDVVVRSPLPI